MTETASSGIRILVVDDHPIVLGGIAGVIRGQPDSVCTLSCSLHGVLFGRDWQHRSP